MKRVTAAIAGGAARWIARPGGRVAPILYYHGVASEAAPEHVSRAAFEEQVRLLSGTSRVQPLDDLVEALGAVADSRGVAGSPVAVTFDDGYANLLEHALPILRRQRFHATVFVVPGRLGGGADWPSPSPSAERRLLSRAELDDVLGAGLSIGAHGWSHVDLTACSPQQLADEVGRCAEFLKREFGIERPLFCYPWGRYDAGVIAEVRRAGFAGAVAGGWGCLHRPTDLFSLRRVAIDWADTLQDFSLKLRGGWGWWTRTWWRDLGRS